MDTGAYCSWFYSGVLYNSDSVCDFILAPLMILMHPARTIFFDDLVGILFDAKADLLVSEKHRGDGLRLYCYTRKATYDRLWTPAALMARGLILDYNRRQVVATPFCKFFNLGEGENQSIPNIPFDVYEKVDGSLIIIFHDGKEWTTATKGSFNSEQAIWAKKELYKSDLSCLSPGTTYLAEAIYPENRIVIHYQEQGLVLLGGYDSNGMELHWQSIREIANELNWRPARRHSFDSLSHLIEHTKSLPVSEEGFVIRFENGLRLKLKGDEYKRVHALISNCTPLAMWGAMKEGVDMNEIRKDLPEEFWSDFDAIIEIFVSRIFIMMNLLSTLYKRVEHLTDKEVGLQLNTFPESARSYIFPVRKNGGVENIMQNKKVREMIFRDMRPTGNVLKGYTPSYAMNRVIEEG